MPFLRAALIKRKKLEPAIERVKVVLTPAVEEQEPEEEFSPTQIEDLHRLIDIRTEEAEQAEQKEQEIPIEPVIVVVPETVTEPEIVTLEAETVPEILEPELQPEIADIELTPEIADIESTPEILETELQPEITETESTPEILEPELTPEIPDIETLPETEQSPELLTEIIIEPEDFTPEAEIEILPEADTVTEEITEPELPPEIPQEEPSLEDIPEIEATQDFDENSLLDEPEQSGTPEIEPLITLEPEPEFIPEPETEISQPEPEPEISEPEPEITEPETESEPEISQPEKSHKDYSGSQLDYDFTSGERYVDKVSTKTEFDKMLDELSAISKELLSWQTDKFARDYTVKFSEGESSQADARKYEAFLGGYITNAAMMLYDKGYRDAAIKQLEQAISILQARKKLEDETSAIKSRVEEQNDAVDLSDILGLFGDG
ncbi:MAG: hypothetical protein IJQ75_03160 [Synergistaceae bacterium]|nr:hypothetical protein [Synergistaceae bacterium]